MDLRHSKPVNCDFHWQADAEYRGAAEAAVYKRRLERAEGKLVSSTIVLVSEHSANNDRIIFYNFFYKIDPGGQLLWLMTTIYIFIVPFFQEKTTRTCGWCKKQETSDI